MTTRRGCGLLMTALLSHGCGAAPARSGPAASAARHPGPCVEHEDRDGDGQPDVVTTWTWGPERRLAARAVDLGADGTEDRREVFAYDGRGRLVAVTSEPGGTRRALTYDEAGRVVETSLSAGALLWVERPEWDAAGRRTGTVRVAGERLLLRVRLELDEGGRVVAEHRDHDGDGRDDLRVRLVRDTAGRVVERQVDRGADGTVEVRLLDELDAAGRLARRRTEPAEGAPSVEARRYDAGGNLVEVVEGPLDGPPARRVRIDYGCWPAAAGSPASQEQVLTSTGAVPWDPHRSPR